MGRTMFEKIWARHVVVEGPTVDLQPAKGNQFRVHLDNPAS